MILGMGVGMLSGILTVALGDDSNVVNSVLEGIEGLVLFLPNLSIGVRRLHDVGKSGWWMFSSFAVYIIIIIGVLSSIGVYTSTAGASGLGMLSGFICLCSVCALVFGIMLIIFWCRPSVGPNKWGNPARPTK
jgi:uncharacterized membrane protein YhaH (DUF805 family)